MGVAGELGVAVQQCVSAVDAVMPRRCIDRDQLRTWAAAVQPLGISAADYVVKLISLTFVLVAHSESHRKSQVDTTQLLPAMSVEDLRQVFRTYADAHTWFLASYNSAQGTQLTDVYQEHQMRGDAGAASETRMVAVNKVATWLAEVTKEGGTCTWVEFCQQIVNCKLWIAGGKLMQLHTASAFCLLSVVQPPTADWVPQKVVGSLKLYQLACEQDGFGTSVVGQKQFFLFLADLSDRSSLPMSDLENMCCKLKVFGDMSGW